MEEGGRLVEMLSETKRQIFHDRTKPWKLLSRKTFREPDTRIRIFPPSCETKISIKIDECKKCAYLGLLFWKVKKWLSTHVIVGAPQMGTLTSCWEIIGITCFPSSMLFWSKSGRTPTVFIFECSSSSSSWVTCAPYLMFECCIQMWRAARSHTFRFALPIARADKWALNETYLCNFGFAFSVSKYQRQSVSNLSICPDTENWMHLTLETRQWGLFKVGVKRKLLERAACIGLPRILKYMCNACRSLQMNSWT